MLNELFQAVLGMSLAGTGVILAVLLARLGKTRDALKEMLDCVKVAPHDAEVQYRLALILLEAGQRPAAETARRPQ